MTLLRYVYLYREFRLLRRVTFFQQLKKVTKKSRHYAWRACKKHRGSHRSLAGFMLWKNSPTKNMWAQTVFTENPWYRPDFEGLANVRKSQKLKEKSVKRGCLNLRWYSFWLWPIIHLSKPLNRGDYHGLSVPVVWASSASSGAAWESPRFDGHPCFLGA